MLRCVVGSHSAPISKKQIKVTIAVVAGIALVVAVGIGASALLSSKATPNAVSTTSPSTDHKIVNLPDSSPTTKPVSYPATPSTTATETTNAPLDYYNAVIPSLLTGAQAKPTVLFEIASPLSTEVPLYASMSNSATPIAKLAAGALTTPTVVDTSGAHPTEVSVVGHFGDWLLITSPGRISTPVVGKTAAVVSFAYARASDFTIRSVSDEVVVNNSASTVALVDSTGKVIQSATATLGARDTPTPAGTVSYVQASYTDPSDVGTCNLPINLTGAHSPTLASYGKSGDAALVGIHCSTATSANSHGCVRTSQSMTNLLSRYVGYAVVFS
jgi:hypothetical protein